MKPGDYVEGYEHYGTVVRRTRGWVDRVIPHGVDIQCDDKYGGARGTSLRRELGEITLLPPKERLSSDHRLNSLSYRIDQCLSLY